MQNLIPVIIIILYTLFFIKNQKLSIIGIIFLLPTYLVRLSIFNIPTTLLELMILGIMFGFIIKTVKNRTDVKFFNLFIPISLFFISGFISTKVADNSISALGILKAYIIEPIIFFLIFINTFNTKKELEVVIKTLGCTVIYLSIYAIFQKITGIGIGTDDPSWINEKTRRVTSLFPYPNALGLFIAPIVTMFLFRIITKIQISNFKFQNNFKNFIFNLKTFIIENIFNFIVLITGLLSIIFAKSAGALMGVIASVILFVFIKSKNKLTTFLIGFICLILLLTLPQTYPIINKTILLGDFSGKIRTQMWEESSNMIREHFILGGGLNNFKNAIIPYHKYTFFELYLYPHNIFLNIWSELGILGFISFFSIVIIFFRKNYFIYTNKLDDFWKDNATDKNISIIENKKNIALIVSLSMFTLIIHGLVDVPFFKNDLSVLFWIFIGIGIINEKIKNNIIIVK